jgi:hypothetical protein
LPSGRDSVELQLTKDDVLKASALRSLRPSTISWETHLQLGPEAGGELKILRSQHGTGPPEHPPMVEGAEIEKKINSPHLVFKKVFSDRKAVDTLTSQSYLKEKLSSEQEMVFQLVDGERTVEEIIDRSLLGRFNTSETLSYLLEMGLIEVVGIRTPNLIKKVSNFRQP